MGLRRERIGPLIRTIAACLGIAAALPGCLFESSHPDGNPGPDPAGNPTLAYRLEAQRAACHVSVRIGAWPAGAPKLFQAPVYYPDNPICPVPGLRAAALDVRDGAGRRLAARDSLSGLPAEGNLILLPDSARSFAYDIDLAPADPGRFGLPAPGVAAGVDLLDGAYIFLLPVLATSVSDRWRAPVGISLDIVAPGRVLAGSDAHRELATPYELMFFRAAFDPVRTLTLPIRDHELTVYTTSGTNMDLGAFAGLLSDCIRQVEDSLLPIPIYRYFAGEVSVFSGVEGIQGYWFNAGYTASAMVHTHELIHTFVGVYHGELDDPWWKEGLANYLGYLLPLQAGRMSDADFAAGIFPRLDTVPAVRETPLASPEVRTRLYLPLDSAWGFPVDPRGFIDLVYGKGGEASMILDRWLLEASGGRNSIFDLVRALIKDHGAAFTRAQLVAEAGMLAGVSAEGFLTDLLDRPGAFPADSLRSTYLALRARGRFGPGGGKNPVAGIDFPVAKASAVPAGSAAHTSAHTPAPVTYPLPSGAKL
jgi:hypothetical protein